MAPSRTLQGGIDGGALAPLLAFVRASGHDTDALCRETGMDPDAFRPSTRRWVPAVLTDRLWESATERVCADLPFRVAETVQPSSYGLLTYILASCPDAETALLRLGKHYHLLSNATRYRFAPDARGGHLLADLRGSRPEPVETFALAVVLHFLRRECVVPIMVNEVRLGQRRPAAAVVAAHVAGFQARVSYGSAAPGLSLAPSSRSTPLRGADPGLLALLEAHAATVTASASGASFALRVRDQIRARGALCTVRAGEVARDLAVTERTLRRLLRADGTSFQNELDAILASLAAERLSSTSVSEVASSLGFSEEAAFRRAFRRWFGATPRAYAAVGAVRPATPRRG